MTQTFLDANELVLNMGPQHPSTHGVLRIVLKLDGERVLSSDCVIGYLHRGVEKIAENRTYAMFAPYVDRSTTTMRAIRYERRAGEDEPLPGQQRMGAHTDYGIVTVLHAEPVAGLQIVGPDGAWIDVIPAEGAMVINLGDLTVQGQRSEVRVRGQEHSA